MALCPYDLRCDDLRDPLGVGSDPPLLSWKLGPPRAGLRQTAYQIEASAQREGKPELWDTGRVASELSVQVRYEGAPCERVWWRVRVWDERGEPSLWSEWAFWEPFRLPSPDARWIGSMLAGGPRTSAPAPCLRRSFHVRGGLVHARLLVSALGLHDTRINGRAVTDGVFLPGWTDYGRRVQLHAFDVLPLLGEGENALATVLGDGWYCGHVGMSGRQLYGDRPRFLAELRLRYADGGEDLVVTDGAWRYAFGSILESDLLMGESCDARPEMPGWDGPGFDDREWLGAQVFDDVEVELSPPLAPPVRRTETVAPVGEARQVGAGRWIFDLGQNIVGRVRLRLRGEEGQVVTLRHAEVLNRDGSLYTECLRTARASDQVVLKGGGEEVYEPTFTFHGFRYVEVSGLETPPAADTVAGIVLHTDLEVTGSFECSDPRLNRLQQNIVWSQRGNFLEVPTDCPQRDERLGWTGDAQVFVRTAAFNMDVAPFFRKWMRDVADAQDEAGRVPMVVPQARLGLDGGPAWADAAVVCPWTVYRCYGDRRILEESYETMARFVRSLGREAREGIRSFEGFEGFCGFGDWLCADDGTPCDLIGTAFFAHSSGLMAQVARVLERPADAKEFDGLRERAVGAFRARFFGGEGLRPFSQTAAVLALQFDLLPEAARQAVADELAADVRRRGDHLATGFVGTPYLLPTLTRFGHLDVAYDLLLQTTCPSWLYPVTQGATTIWERWDGIRPDGSFQDVGMNSFNHYAYGAVGEWLYAAVAGIDLDPVVPGYRRFRLHPRPGGGIEWARASLETRYGRIESDWRTEGGRFRWRFVVPPGTEARVVLLDGSEEDAGPGEHERDLPCRTPDPSPRSI